MESKETVVGGLTNRWIEPGSGRPAVLVHGIPTSPRLWRRGHGRRSVARESIGEHWQPHATHGAAASLMSQMTALDVADTIAAVRPEDHPEHLAEAIDELLVVHA